jgi:hypothetical protein
MKFDLSDDVAATVSLLASSLFAFALIRYVDVRSELRAAIEKEVLNNTVFADQEGLIFNRVPKVRKLTQIYIRLSIAFQ